MEKKAVLITGATKGIGLETSKRLSHQGYLVIGIARHVPEESYPGKFFQCDLSDLEQTAEIIQTISSKHSIDALVNNVGISQPEPLGSIHLESLYNVYDLNVRTAVQITQGFLEKMKAKKWGRIINISSRAIFGVQGRTSYAAAKSALIGCTRTWALELAPFSITVNAIAPGPIETELFRKTRKKGSPEEEATLNTIPLRRIGLPREIAAAIEFLLSEDASFITGQTLCIDGGASL